MEKEEITLMELLTFFGTIIYCIILIAGFILGMMYEWEQPQCRYKKVYQLVVFTEPIGCQVGKFMKRDIDIWQDE